MRLFISSLFFITGATLLAQQFPPNISWKILYGTHYNLLYPSELNTQAAEILTFLEEQHDYITSDYEQSFPKITIILNHVNTLANGYVALAPWKSAFYLFPPTEPEISGSDWITLLALHEARHMVQIATTRRSTTKLFWLLGGEQGWTVAVFGSIPLWYTEGDAVVFETLATKGGRGRSPRFGRQTRAIWLANQQPSYSQAFLGSYYYYYPNHYELGYLLTRHLRLYYGPKAGKQAIYYTSEFPHPWRFSGALEKITQKDVDEFYLAAMTYYHNLWQRQQENLNPTPFKKVRQPQEPWLSYDHPQYDGLGNLYAVKSGFDYLSQLVLLTTDEDQVKAPVGILYDDFVFVDNKGGAWWTEYRPKPRFLEAGWTYLGSPNLTNQPQQNISRVVLSPDSSLLAFLVTHPNGSQSIEIRSVANNQLLYTVEHDKAQLQGQRFSIEGNYLDYLVISQEGRALWQIDLATKQKKILLPATSYAIADPHGNRESVYFSAPYSGLEAIWRLERKTGNLFQVIEHEIGAFRPSLSPDGQKLAFNYHTVNGYGVGEVTLKEIQEIPLAKVLNREDGLSDFAQTKEVAKSSSQPPQWREENYSYFKAAFNIHSWLPFFNVTTRDIQLSLRSNNLLNSVGWNLGYIHNLNERTHYGYSTIQYAGLWPIFSLTAGYGNRAIQVTDTTGELSWLSWQERVAELGTSLPLVWLWGHWQTSLLTSVKLRHIEQYWSDNQIPEDSFEGSILPLAVEANYSLTRRMARRELQPRWGLVSSILWQTNTQPSQRIAGQQAYYVIVYLPGLWLNHGLSFSLGQEYQKGNANYLFPAYQRFARGYSAVLAAAATHFSADYILPLFYPDLNLLHIAYLRRVKVNFFRDHTVLEQKFYYDSAGIELTTDIIPLKLNIFEVDFGLRWSHLLQEKKDNFEIFLRAIRSGSF